MSKKVPTSGVKAHPDGTEYLSDVNTHASEGNYRSDSEASVDFVTSARNIEDIFKYKYRVLRQAYEDRLSNLSNVVENTCGALMHEEIGTEMSRDATTLGYLPAHLAEVFTNHLNDEREHYLSDTLNKLKALEFQSARRNEIVDTNIVKMKNLEKEISECRHRELEVEPLRYHARDLEEQIKALKRDHKHEIDELTHRNESLTLENHKLDSDLELAQSALQNNHSEYESRVSDVKKKNNEFLELEKHCNRLERELARVGEVDALNEEFQLKLKKCVQERDVLRDEVGSYRRQLKDAADELMKCQVVIDEHVQSEEANKVLMAYVWYGYYRNISSMRRLRSVI